MPTMIPIEEVLDDAGLDPVQFRLCFHIARVGGSTPLTTASIVKTVQLSRGKVVRALKALEARNIISVQRLRNSPNQFDKSIFRLNPSSHWID